MYVLRTLLSYSLLIVIVVALVLAYYYRDTLMPEVNALYDDVKSMVSDEPAEQVAEAQPAEQTVEIVQTEVDVVATPEESGQTVDEVTQTEVIESRDSSGVETVEVPQTEVTEVVEQQSTTTEPAAEQTLVETGTTESVVAAESMQEVTSVSSEPATEDTAVASAALASTESEQPMAQEAQPVEAATGEEPDTSNIQAELINDARVAYWRGNYDEAVEAYKKLLELNSDNPNLYGELGNLYYAMGKWELAGDAYYQASQGLLKTGQTKQLNYLVRVLEGLNAELAEKLKQDIKEKK